MAIISLPTRNFCSKCRIYFKLELNNCPLCSNLKNSVSNKVNENNDQFTSNSRRVKFVKRKYKKNINNSIYERFHNYGVKFDAEVQWDHLFKYEEKTLRNNVKFKRIDLDLAIVKVFKKKIGYSILVTLREREEVNKMNVKEAERISIEKVNKTLDSLPKSIVVKDRMVVNNHNAFVNHPTASVFKKEFNREMNVKDDDGNTILITDNSKGHSELEYVKPDLVIPLSEHREAYEKDLCLNRVDFPSIQDKKINYIVDVLNEYAINMKKHVEVMDKISTGIDNLNSSIKSTKSSTLTSISTENLQVKGLNLQNNDFKLNTISRYDDRKDIIRKWSLNFK